MLRRLDLTSKRNWQRILRKTKSFYAYVKGKAKTVRNIGPLNDVHGVVIDSPSEMCEEFNKFFGLVFTNEKLGEIPQAKLVYKKNDDRLCDILINEESVIVQLHRLRDDKAAGADDLVPRF